MADRKRPFSTLRLVGGSLGVLRRVALLETAVPLLAVATVSIGMGPKTVHTFVYANGTAITRIGADLPPPIGWVELRPEGLPGTSRDDGLAFRIGGRRRPAAGESSG